MEMVKYFPLSDVTREAHQDPQDAGETVAKGPLPAVALRLILGQEMRKRTAN